MKGIMPRGCRIVLVFLVDWLRIYGLGFIKLGFGSFKLGFIYLFFLIQGFWWGGLGFLKFG